MEVSSAVSAWREMVGTTPGELVTKIGVTALVLFVNAVDEAGFFIVLFVFMLLGDAVLGTMIAVRNEGWMAIRPWRWITGPALKSMVVSIVLVMASLFDAIVRKTPLDDFTQSPLLIAVAAMASGVMLVEAASKADRLAGLGLADAITSRLPGGIKPPTPPTP